jgi:S1-C subfamily serine protease
MPSVISFARPAALSAAFFLLPAVSLFAQAPGVKIVRDRGEEFAALVEQAGEHRVAGRLLSAETVSQQLLRTNCVLALPKPGARQLTDRQIWQRSQAAHVRVGWNYLCTRCDKWHLNLAGGYFVTADGAVATCYHVVKPDPDHREGFLVAADEQGLLLPVTEILAANQDADVALIRVQTASPVKPLPLNTNTYPGDKAWCYSDPLGRSSYFSQGMVNRFFWQQRRGRESARIEVSTDWAPGSSGAAVVDVSGNAIGHVSEISSAGVPRSRGTNQTASAASSVIVFHCACRAADVIALVQPPSKR